MNDHEILSKVLETLVDLKTGQDELNAKYGELKTGQDELQAGQQALVEKADRNFEEIVRAVGNVVTVIGEKIDENEKEVLSRVEALEDVSSQNAFDIQQLRRRRA